MIYLHVSIFIGRYTILQWYVVNVNENMCNRMIPLNTQEGNISISLLLLWR
jgi:hypothetical protein